MQNGSSENLNPNMPFEGFAPDLIELLTRELSEHYGIVNQFKIRVVKDNSYGSQLEDGSWSGMVGELIRRVSSQCMQYEDFWSIFLLCTGGPLFMLFISKSKDWDNLWHYQLNTI